MKHKDLSRDRSQTPRGASVSAVVADSSQKEINFAPAPDEVARRAYFSYVNRGSLPGHEVQHWLAAEARWLAERKLARTHGFHNKT